MGRIEPLPALPDREGALAAIEAIFFASAATRDFASEAARAEYRDLWLGRYLSQCPAQCFVALDDSGAVAGYLAGSLISDAGALAGPDYYDAIPSALIAAYPAHLHVNVRQDCRGKAIGSDLVAAFRAHCRSRALPGLHAITAAESRAAAFFSRCGLTGQARADWRGRRLVFLGQRLAG